MPRRIVRPGVRHEPCWWANEAQPETGLGGLLGGALLGATLAVALTLGVLLWLV